MSKISYASIVRGPNVQSSAPIQSQTPQTKKQLEEFPDLIPSSSVQAQAVPTIETPLAQTEQVQELAPEQHQVEETVTESNNSKRPFRNYQNRPKTRQQPRNQTDNNTQNATAGNYGNKDNKTFEERLNDEKMKFLSKFKQEKEKLCFELKFGDLFSVDPDVSLAHCVSQEFKMSKGIATEFKKRFGRVDELLNQNAQIGNLAYIKHENRYVFYLVTKKVFYFKPYYSSLEKSLKALKLKCEQLKVTNLAMPMIGSGLDQLDWNIVSRIIDSIFSKSDINITVYKYEKRNE